MVRLVFMFPIKSGTLPLYVFWLIRGTIECFKAQMFGSLLVE